MEGRDAGQRCGRGGVQTRQTPWGALRFAFHHSCPGEVEVIGHGPLLWSLAIHSRLYVSGQHNSQPPRAVSPKGRRRELLALNICNSWGVGVLVP